MNNNNLGWEKGKWREYNIGNGTFTSESSGSQSTKLLKFLLENLITFLNKNYIVTLFVPIYVIYFAFQKSNDLSLIENLLMKSSNF